MKKRTAVLVVTLLLLFGVGLSSPATSSCADCAKGGAVDTAAQEHADDVFTECCQTFGCFPTGSFTNYCADQADQAHDGYVILHGCPNLVY